MPPKDAAGEMDPATAKFWKYFAMVRFQNKVMWLLMAYGLVGFVLAGTPCLTFYCSRRNLTHQ